MTEDNIIKKKSYKKKDKYQKEQEEIVKRLNDILELDDKNNKFVLEELKQDLDKQNKILGLEEDVKRYFTCSNWGYFKGFLNEDTKGICLAKSIFKACNYEVNYKQKMKNGFKYTEYNIMKKNI
jgi:hypothetical protein